MPRGDWSTEERTLYGWNVMCNILRVEYDVATQTGDLYIPVGECTDMGRTIDCFTSIDSIVLVIRVHAGEFLDVCYARTHAEDDWVALSPPRSSVIKIG